MEVIKKELEARLQRSNLSKEMLEDNKQETQMVLGELSGELAQIRMNMVKQNNLCHIIKTQIQAANSMNDLLMAYQGRLEDCKANIPQGARKQNLPGNTDAPNNKGKENKKTELQESKDDSSSPELKGSKSNVDQVEFISIPEFDTVPKYMKGRVQFATMNSAVEEINTALEEKYSFMARTFVNMSTISEKKKYKNYKSQENKTTTAGVHFITADDLKGAQVLKSELSRRSLLTILRHLKKIKEIRGPGSIVRIAPVHC
jgi:hypothetical protein